MAIPRHIQKDSPVPCGPPTKRRENLLHGGVFMDMGSGGISAMDYRNMLIKIFSQQGFKTFQTNEPNIMMRPENLFMVRIGANISEEIRKRFKLVRFDLDLYS